MTKTLKQIFTSASGQFLVRSEEWWNKPGMKPVRFIWNLIGFPIAMAGVLPIAFVLGALFALAERLSGVWEDA